MFNKDILIHNRFDFIIRDAITEEVIREEKCYNIILNTFWDSFLAINNQTIINYIQFGSGITAPVVTDVSLGTLIGGKTVATKTFTYPDIYNDGVAKRFSSIRLEANEYNGTTISEVGLASAANTGLKTKSLLKDQNGNPISITKTELVIIDIYASFFVKLPNTAIGAGQHIGFTNSGWLLDWLLCNSNAFNYTEGYLSRSLFFPDGFRKSFEPVGQAYAMGYPTPTFNKPNKKIIQTFANINAGNGNINGASLIASVFGGSVGVKIPNPEIISPKIIKEVIGTGDGIKTQFNCKFGRIKDDGQAIIYVNDIPATGTLLFNTPHPLDNANSFLVKVGARTWFNQYHALYPITSLTGNVSSDFKVMNFYGKANLGDAWISLGSIYSSSNYNITASVSVNNPTFRYFMHDSWTFVSANCAAIANIKEITLTSPPANGDVISLTYNTNCIPKDANSVFNGITVSLTFAEYTPT